MNKQKIKSDYRKLNNAALEKEYKGVLDQRRSLTSRMTDGSYMKLIGQLPDPGARMQQDKQTLEEMTSRESILKEIFQEKGIEIPNFNRSRTLYLFEIGGVVHVDTKQYFDLCFRHKDEVATEPSFCRQKTRILHLLLKENKHFWFTHMHHHLNKLVLKSY
jgi:hypothetical protein